LEAAIAQQPLSIVSAEETFGQSSSASASSGYSDIQVKAKVHAKKLIQLKSKNADKNKKMK
jgi:hypothetical protein